MNDVARGDVGRKETFMKNVDSRTSTRLRQWAAGLLAAQAAVELVLRAVGGRFADPAFPWVRLDGDITWLDPDAMREHAARAVRR